MKPRVVLADDHVMVAEGISLVLTRVAEVVARVVNGQQLVETVRRERPAIVVSDITMPVMSGLDALRALRAERVPARFIFLTINAEPRLAAEAMRAGARGYLLKSAAGEELVEAIRMVMAGRTYLSPSVAADALWLTGEQRSGVPQLTRRQHDVLRLVAQGKRMKEIAAELGLAVRTVEDHKAHVMHALGCESTADLVRFAVKQGLLPE